jgi:hypothetical protein
MVMVMVMVMEVVVIRVLAPVLLVVVVNLLWPVFSRVFRLSWWMMGGMTSLLHVLCVLFVNNLPVAYKHPVPCANLLMTGERKTDCRCHSSVAAKVFVCPQRTVSGVQSLPRAATYWSLFCLCRGAYSQLKWLSQPPGTSWRVAQIPACIQMLDPPGEWKWLPHFGFGILNEKWQVVNWSVWSTDASAWGLDTVSARSSADRTNSARVGARTLWIWRGTRPCCSAGLCTGQSMWDFRREEVFPSPSVFHC